MLVFDATPLIYLAKAGVLSEADCIDGDKLVPGRVYREVVLDAQDEPDARRIENVIQEGTFDVVEVENPALDGFESSEKFTSADISVLCLADRENAAAVMDEKAGRKLAAVEDIETRGTAFFLLRMLQEGGLSQDEAEAALDQMVDAGWYCSTSLYKDVLNKIKELG